MDVIYEARPAYLTDGEKESVLEFDCMEMMTSIRTTWFRQIRLMAGVK